MVNLQLRKARYEYKSHFEAMKPSDASAPQGKNQGTSHQNKSVVTKGMSVSIFYKNCTHNATVKKVATHELNTFNIWPIFNKTYIPCVMCLPNVGLA